MKSLNIALNTMAFAILTTSSLHAKVILPVAFTTPTLTFGVNPTLTAQLLPTGVKYFGNLSAECGPTVVVGCAIQFEVIVQNTDGPTLQLDYIFDLNPVTAGAPISWTISDGAAATYASGVGGNSTGSAVIPNGTVQFRATSGDTAGFDLVIPANSIDFTQTSATPEPSSLLLGGAGLAAVFAQRRRFAQPLKN